MDIQAITNVKAEESDTPQLLTSDANNGSDDHQRSQETPEKASSSEPQVKKIKTNGSAEGTPQIPGNDGPPVHEVIGGTSVRQYLNKHLTEHLLEGLKHVAKHRAEDPLLELGNFLIRRSQEVNNSD